MGCSQFPYCFHRVFFGDGVLFVKIVTVKIFLS